MILFKTQKSIAFIPFDYPDPLMKEIFQPRIKNQGMNSIQTLQKSEDKFEFLLKLGYHLPDFPDKPNHSNMKNYGKLLLPTPHNFYRGIPHLGSLKEIFTRIKYGGVCSTRSRVKIDHKKIRRGFTKN